MVFKKYSVLALLVILALLLPVGSSIPVAANGVTLSSGSMSYGGYTRTWKYYVPTSYNASGDPVPLVFSFHGVGSNGVEQEDLTKFAELAENETFIVVLPNATDIPGDHPILILGQTIQWNVGYPGSMQYEYDVDDLGFVSELVDKFKEDYNIDASRVYATGFSDGSLFTNWLALNLPGTFAGFGPVSGQMWVEHLSLYDFDQDVGCPATVVMMHGTADPIVPYGGTGDELGSVDDTIAYWRDANNTTTGPTTTQWGPTGNDTTVVTRYVYGGGTNGTEVVLYKVQGGGHTWPGGPQYLDPYFIGVATTHIDGTAEMWDILKNHALPPLPPIRQSAKEVIAGEEFEVTINFAAPAGNFTNITLTDTAPAGWTVSVDTTWPDPPADGADTPTSNEAEYTWNGPYDEGTAFSAVYKVTVPGGATPGTYTFTGSLDYSIGGGSQGVAVAGNTRVKVVDEYTLTITSSSGGSVTMPSGTGPFTYREGKVVYLKAEPDTGYEFVNWTGDVGTLELYGTEDPQYPFITMEGDYSIQANFAEIEEPGGGGMCFIATAAYGTSTAKQLDVLREFRDDVLLKSTLGSRLVDLYYKVSPPIADFISENSVVRTLVREFLIDPIVWLVEATAGIWRN